MQVMAFFLSNTTTVDLRVGCCCLTVELRPADEGKPATMIVYSAEDSDITESSDDDVGDVHCQEQRLQRRGRFVSECYR